MGRECCISREKPDWTVEVYRPEGTEEEVTVLQQGVTVEVTVEKVTVLQAGTQQGGRRSRNESS